MKRMRQRVLVLLLAAAMASSQCPAVLAEDLTDDQVETEGIRTEENVDQNTENPEEGTIPEESEETGETDKTTGTDGEDTGKRVRPVKRESSRENLPEKAGMWTSFL